MNDVQRVFSTTKLPGDSFLPAFFSTFWLRLQVPSIRRRPGKLQCWVEEFRPTTLRVHVPK